MWKNGTAGQAENYNMAYAHCMLDCWIPKTTNTHSQYVMLIAFSLQQWLHESASMLHFDNPFYKIHCLFSDTALNESLYRLIFCLLEDAQTVSFHLSLWILNGRKTVVTNLRWTCYPDMSVGDWRNNENHSLSCGIRLRLEPDISRQ
jgi:hypothetical protein